MRAWREVCAAGDLASGDGTAHTHVYIDSVVPSFSPPAPSWQKCDVAVPRCYCGAAMMGMQAAAPSFAEAGAYHLPPPRDIVFPSAAVADPGQSAALPVDLLVRAEHFSTLAL